MKTQTETKPNIKPLAKHTEEEQQDFKNRLNKLLEDSEALRKIAPPEIEFLVCTVDLEYTSISMSHHSSMNFTNAILRKLIQKNL